MKHYILSFHGKKYDLNSFDFQDFVLHRLKLNSFQVFELLTKNETSCGGSVLKLEKIIEPATSIAAKAS